MTMNDEFLPADYIVPDKSNGYMKFKQGDNIFRIVSKPITGAEWWVEEGESKKPMRVRPGTNIPGSVGFADKIKHFWAIVVWNYDAKQLQVLEITQKGIQTAITSLSRDKAWGNPMGYDLKVIRVGEGMDTEYTVMPRPKTDLTEEVATALEQTSINLDALFDGGDPFAPKDMATTEQVDEEEILFDEEGNILN